MQRSTVFLTLMLLLIARSARAADLEPARDAIRRHEYALAVSLLRPQAEAGDAEASFQLSQILRYGRGVARDLPQACRLLEGAATAGHARAAGSLAAMLESAECATSARTADEWRAAARGAGYAPPGVATEQSHDVLATSADQLLRATRAGDLPLVLRLLDSQPIDVTDEYGRTPIMLAIDAGHLAVARELANHGASLAAADRNGDTPLLLAARAGNAGLLSILLERRAPVDAANNSGTTSLMIAARAGSRELCTQLLAAGANPGLLDAAGLRAGDHAASSGHPGLAETLGVRARRSSAGPVRSDTLHAGQTPLMIAAESGDLKSLSERLAAGGDVNASDITGMTALAFAARAGQVTTVEALLAAGATVDARDRAGWTPLGRALQSGHANTARLLLQRDADPRARQGNGKPPLLLAIESTGGDAIRMLVDAGADSNVIDDAGMTPLMAAASANDADSIRILLAAGARPDVADTHKCTALWFAASQGAPLAVAELAPRSALNAANDSGTTPLAAAVGGGHRKVVEALLTAGADARITTRNGYSVLHVAAASREAALIPLLIAARAPVDGVNSRGDTALMLGVKSGCLACVRNLISASASTRVRNADGLSALDIARLSTDEPLVKLLD
jgi:hypothetical protein